MIAFGLWWCVDDAIAALAGRPELGELPWLLVLVVCLILGEVRR